MPFPYELYPKAKETHCLNLPEISVSRPPFPGSIRTADGCFWGERNNNSYVSTHKTDKVCTADGKCYNYNDVFVDEVDPGYSNTCGQTCYVACSCNTSNGWYSSCQGSDCFSVTDTRYAGQPNAASASRSLSDVASISASGANSGISASAAAKSGLKTASAAGNYTATAASAAAAATGATSDISTMASGATTCYKTKTCSEGGYYDSVPADQKCSSKSYNGYSCYTSCSYKTCSDYGYNSSIPSGKTCTTVYPRSGLTCYKDCKDEDPCLGVTCGMNAHCKDGECVCDDDYYYIFLGSDTAKKYGCPLACPICEYSSCIMDCIDNSIYRDTQECIEMICAPGCGLHGEFTKPADNYYEQEGVSGDYGCYNYDFNYKCPDNIPFPYNPNGEKCCCVDLNWVGGSGPGNIQIPTSCVCYGTVTRP